MGMKPLLVKRSCAVASFLKRPDLPSVTPCVWDESRNWPLEARIVVAPLPGCLTMPKFLQRGR